MTDQGRPPATAAARAVDANNDQLVKLGACRAVLREALKLCMQIGGGTMVEGIEEVIFGDNLNRTLLDYVKSKQSREFGATYVGITANLRAAADQSLAIAPAQEQQDQEQAAA